MSTAHGNAYMHYSKLSHIGCLDSKTEFFIIILLDATGFNIKKKIIFYFFIKNHMQ